MKLLEENRLPLIWVPSPAIRDLRQLLWHRHRLVQMRTPIMNRLQALAMNEGYRWKKKLFSEQEMRSKRVVFCVLRALYADFPLRATGSLLALIDFTRSADDAPSSDNP